MDSYEEWSRSEISRLRAEAETLQRSLDKWLELRGVRPGSKPDPAADGDNSPAPPRRRRKATTYGSKNAAAIALIKEAPHGLTMDEIYEAFVEMYGAAYKRSSLRALLWNQKKAVKIDIRNGRYVIAGEAHHA
jgi:hypothetical protein